MMEVDLWIDQEGGAIQEALREIKEDDRSGWTQVLYKVRRSAFGIRSNYFGKVRVKGGWGYKDATTAVMVW